jgi:peptidyl-prolyl cis-trans isomerase C
MVLPSFRGFILSQPAWRFVLLAAIALLATSCHPRATNPHDPKFIVAEKGDWTITRAQLDKEMNSYMQQRQVTPQQVGSRMPILETVVLKNMILEKIILARAATLPLKDVDQEEKAAYAQIKSRFPTEQDFQTQMKQANLTDDEFKKQIHEEVLIHKVLEMEAMQNTDPTDQQVNDFYLQHKDLFNEPPKLRASRVLVMVDAKATPAEKSAKKKVIDAAHARVAKGEDFSKVAMQVSEDRYSAPKGGDIGFFQRGENEAQFDDIAFNLKPGVLSPVFETPMGYQFIKVTDTHPGGPVSVADARSSIAEHLKQENTNRQEQDYTQKLLKDSGVAYHITLVDPPAPPAGASLPPDQNGGDSAPPQSPPPPQTGTETAPAQ